MKKTTYIVFGLLILVIASGGIFYVLLPVNFAVVPSRGGSGIDLGLSVEPGYRISLFAEDLGNPRFMEVTAFGDLLVADTGTNSLVLLAADKDGDGTSDSRRVLVSDLDRAHDIALWQGWLYIAETDVISRISFDAKQGRVEGERESIVSGLPAGGNHWTRTIAFGPDGLLYLSLGSSCNVCLEQDSRRAAITRYQPDGSDEQVFARGLRNSVGFDWSPQDGGLYATDNGRDWLGDDFPPDELNHIVEKGFYGWPYVNGDGVSDPDFGEQLPVALQPVSPVHGFGAHNAALGIIFLRSENHPASMDRAALVALHGSWNRSTKDGYKVVSLHWGADGVITERDFLTGFLNGDSVSGRPAGLAESEDGDIYLSDDFTGKVYRISPLRE